MKSLLQLCLPGIPKFRAEVQAPRNLSLHKFELPKSLWNPGMTWLQGTWAHWHQEPLHKSRSRCHWPQTALSKVTRAKSKGSRWPRRSICIRDERTYKCLWGRFPGNISLGGRGHSSFTSEGKAAWRTSQESDHLSTMSSNLRSPLGQTWRRSISMLGQPQWRGPGVCVYV